MPIAFLPGDEGRDTTLAGPRITSVRRRHEPAAGRPGRWPARPAGGKNAAADRSARPGLGLSRPRSRRPHLRSDLRAAGSQAGFGGGPGNRIHLRHGGRGIERLFERPVAGPGVRDARLPQMAPGAGRRFHAGRFWNGYGPRGPGPGPRPGKRTRRWPRPDGWADGRWPGRLLRLPELRRKSAACARTALQPGELSEMRCENDTRRMKGEKSNAIR